jgi:ubiquinone/menaquinone biosynthesis C-methylase UbiE
MKTKENQLSQPVLADEVNRINHVYDVRQYDVDPEYSERNSVYLQRVEKVERTVLNALTELGLTNHLGDLRLLDVGCGNGSWFKRWREWGASGSRLTGVDLRDSAIALARQEFPDSHFVRIDGPAFPFRECEFDIIVQNLAFSSILSPQLRKATADEITRVLKPGGVVLSWDMMVNNPRNPNVKAVRRRDLASLFTELDLIQSLRVTLAPPLARVLVPRSRWIADVLESCCPFLRTHLFAVLKKRPSQNRPS